MDDYDKKAREIGERLDGIYSGDRAFIAQALRESAAEILGEAAKMARELGGISATNKMNDEERGKTKAAEFLANRYDEMAAALRQSPQGRP